MNSKAIHCRLYNEEIEIRSDPDVVIRALIITISIEPHNHNASLNSFAIPVFVNRFFVAVKNKCRFSGYEYEINSLVYTIKRSKSDQCRR